MASERLPIAPSDYWPFHDEVEMPETPVHVDATRYLRDVLLEQYSAEQWYIAENLAIYGPAARNPLTPDVAAFLGVIVPDKHAFTSWRIRPPLRPAPSVVFEIASKDTWTEDFEKLPIYGAWGMQEVYIFDPGIPRIWKGIKPRLRGWRMVSGSPQEMTPDDLGRLWSGLLDSFLLDDTDYLRLVARDGSLRLTRAEAERDARIYADALVEAERAARIRADTVAEQERTARIQADAARTQADAQITALRAKLRALGIDPDAPP